jgi:hypothetical protein
MIVVTVELHSARTGKVTSLGRMHISNTGEASTLDGLHDYDVEIMRKGTTNKVQRRGLVSNYPRQAYTVWELVKRALIAGLGKNPIHPGTPEEFNEQVSRPTFEDVWALKEAEGYQYGEDALEQVKFGWQLAQGNK